MYSWFEFLKQSLARKPVEDPIGDKKKYAGVKENLKNLKPFFLRHWRKGLWGAALVLFTSLLGLPVPLVTRYLIDNVILGRQMDLLLGVVLVLAVIKFLGMGVGAYQQFYFTRFERVVLLDIQQDLLDRTLRFPKSFFDSKETGYLMSRLLSDVRGLHWFFSSTMVHIVSSFLRLIGGVALLIYLRWQLAIAVLVILPAMVWLVLFFSRKVRILSHHGMEQQAHVTRSMQESLSATSLIKAFSSEKRTLGDLMSELRASLQIGMEHTTLSSAAGLAVGLVPEVARLVVLAVGAYWVIRGEWSLGSLLAFQSYLGYVYGPAHFLATSNLRLQNALASLERVSALFDIVPEENLDQGLGVERLRGEIAFQDVSFSYDGKEMVLENVSFDAHPGQRIAIVGPSGVGKTTLVSLILGFYKPSGGDILFDRLPVSQYRLSSLRQRIGYVSQKPHLLSGTVRENLCYGNPEADQVQVVQAARVAGIHDFITDLPEGYGARVGERGINLSEGQIQRLALARALLKDPDILILDEPTSALDSLVERSILDALPELVRHKTLFVVAHRMSTIRSADRILLLNEKRLVAVGTHRELREKSEYYRALLSNQMFNDPPEQ